MLSSLFSFSLLFYAFHSYPYKTCWSSPRWSWCGTATIVVIVLEKYELYTKSTNLCSLCWLTRAEHGFVLGSSNVFVSRWATTKTYGMTTQYFGSKKYAAIHWSLNILTVSHTSHSCVCQQGISVSMLMIYRAGLAEYFNLILLSSLRSSLPLERDCLLHLGFTKYFSLLLSQYFLPPPP